LNAKGHAGDVIAEEVTKANSMCSHKINLGSEAEANKKVLTWIKKAYESAG